jgi:hypothetical protein
MNIEAELQRAEKLIAENEELRKKLGGGYQAYNQDELQSLKIKTRDGSDEALSRRLAHAPHWKGEEE